MICYLILPIFTMLPLLVSLWNWLLALSVVCMPFLNMAAVWWAWQAGIGWAAWSTARFYSNNCAPAGVSGYVTSLFTMGSPICISAWFSHAAFVVAYITAFVVAVMVVSLWLWNRVTGDQNMKKLQAEVERLRVKTMAKSPEMTKSPESQIVGGESEEVEI